MSIPPLVCSTPPPPDQCEDDKEPDDFDLQYLSQEDYEDTYDDYGNFSTFNHFEASTSTYQKSTIPVVTKITEQENNIDETKEATGQTELASSIPESKLKFEEDTNIEDLNLIVDKATIDQTDISNTKDICAKTEAEVYPERNTVSDDSVLPTDIPSTANVEQDDLSGCELPRYEYAFETTSVQDVLEPHYLIKEKSNEDQINEKELNKNAVEVSTVADIIHKNLTTEPEQGTDQTHNIIEDDFGDFDEFQFAGSETNTAIIIEESDNPWSGSIDNESTGFSNFKANFDDNESQMILPSDTVVECSKEKETLPTTELCAEKSCDDFGDFDDFKSSANETEENSIIEDSVTCQQGPVINLHSQDNEKQFIESINSVLSSIFEQEISEPESKFECKLETLLSETWGHLLETDVRQPYIVNWNNSFGQKTLLKALCIDSRNILFGPKWNYNMPKYAANLSVAPLQPQKQAITPIATQNDSPSPSIEKSGVKPTGIWNDPFSTEGQESCNTDRGGGNDVAETGPTDLDVFEATVTPKTENIYSSTLSVQPLRQISLPDTHIFTPTDSETPRSKTIHYDIPNRPPVLLTQTAVENKVSPENLTPHSSDNAAGSNMEKDNEYWEFQDFKGTSEVLSTNTSSQLPVQTIENKPSNINTNVTYGTQVLQPIKVEPIIPTLNWPDPGEVKETFEDFSDFIANSSWNAEKESTHPHQTITQPVENTTSSQYERPDISKDDIRQNDRTLPSNHEFDDDFNTFQSALPTSSTSQLGSTGPTMASIIPPRKSISTEFETTFSMLNQKSDTISTDITNKLKESAMQKSLSFTNSLDNNKNLKKVTDRTSPLQSGISQQNPAILQPILASPSTSHNHKKSGQILQPLSLESYSQINWPNPGVDLQDLSRFNPVETLQSLKSDLSTNSHSKVASPVHNQKNSTFNQMPDDDIWGDFVSSKPKSKQLSKKAPSFVDDDEWTDFVSSPSIKPQNGLNTISLNVHTNLNIQKSNNQSKFAVTNNQIPLDIPTLNYITPKSSTHKTYNDRHFQNL